MLSKAGNATHSLDKCPYPFSAKCFPVRPSINMSWPSKPGLAPCLDRVQSSKVYKSNMHNPVGSFARRIDHTGASHFAVAF